MQVDSSNISDVDYDAEQQELRVTFKNGAVYRYSGVPRTVFDQIRTAPSPGKAFYALVREGGYPYERVE